MKKGCLWAIAIFFIYIIVINLIGMHTEKDIASVYNDVDTTSVAKEKSIKSSEKKGWTHTEEKDEMRGGTDTYDFITSDNAVDFGFPYNGGSSLHIVIRHSIKYGTDVYLSINKGQFSGNEYSNDNYVSIKFDNGEIKKYYFNEPSDGSTSTVFLRKEKELIAKFKTAKNIMIEAPFFQEGRRVFKFNNIEPYSGK